jgi:hypothetical protein
MPGKRKSAKRTASRLIEHEVSVVGLGFRLKADVRRALADTAARSRAGIEGFKLVREQENRDDINALKVVHPDRGALAKKHIGYLPREVAAVLAPLMDDYAATRSDRSIPTDGIEFLGAKLIELDERTQYKVGTMVVTFADHRDK